MTQYLLRTLVRQKNVMGITIPSNIAIFFKETLFTIEKSGTDIILHSGCDLTPTIEQISNYKFEDCLA